MKKYFVLALTLVMYTAAFSQKFSAEAEAMLNKMMADPKFKSIINEDDVEEKKQFPLPDKMRMASLPSTPANEGQMSGYLKNLYTAYKTKMPVGAVNAMQSTLKLAGQDGDKLGVAAISNWYNGAPETATMLALQAAIQQPGDPLTLNNLGALLHLGGASYHALPVLRSLVNRYPDNPMVLNNIGQAYAGVGQLDTAMTYFGRCIKKSPHHPEANNTAGQIEKSRGNKEKAITHFENALKGSHHLEALEGLEELTGDEAGNHVPSLRASIDFPYFNEYKYQLPRQCSGPGDAPYIAQEHEDFVRFIESMQTQYSNLGAAALKAGNKKLDKHMEKLQRELMASLRAGLPPKHMYTPGGPLGMAFTRKLVYLPIELQRENAFHLEKMKNLEAVYKKLLDDYDKAYDDITTDYSNQIAKYDCGEGRGSDCAAIERLIKEQCQKLVNLGNSSQGPISAAKKDIQTERLRYIRWEFKLDAYYGYITGLNEELAQAAFFRAAARYLADLKALAYDPKVVAGGKCNDEQINVHPKPESDDSKTMNCPINVNIPFVIGKLELNCEKFSFSAGEGVIFKMEKDFMSGQSTMMISAGLQFEGSKEWGIFSGEVSAGATQSFYITWDKENKISDAGIAFTAEAGAKGGTKLDTPGEIGKDYLQEFQKEIGHKAEFGYTMGINSGWTFNDGYLNGMVKSMGNIFK